MLPDAPWFTVGDDAVRLLRDGAQAFPAMLSAIAQAQREILLEMYWIGADAVGARFRDALAARARDGVKVLAIHDAVGSLGITPAWWRPLSDAGGRVFEYHSISPFDPRFRLERVEHRDHRKLLITDSIHAYTGGINLASPWLSTPSRSGARRRRSYGRYSTGPGASSRARARLSTSRRCRADGRARSGCSRASGVRAGASASST